MIADAEGEADRFVQILKEYSAAPDVTRERLYLETLEAILSNSKKVLLDTEGGNNLLYLPLDQLTQRRDQSAAPSSGAGLSLSDNSSGVDAPSGSASPRR